jgi:hypothetical protein
LQDNVVETANNLPFRLDSFKPIDRKINAKACLTCCNALRESGKFIVILDTERIVALLRKKIEGESAEDLLYAYRK